MEMSIEDALRAFVSSNNSSNEKISFLGFMDHYFEYTSGLKYENQAIMVSNNLITYLIKESDDWVREVTLSTLLNFCCYLPIENKINLDVLAQNINTFSVPELSYVIILLGWSGNNGYRDLIKSYQAIPELGEDVKEALMELDYRSGD